MQQQETIGEKIQRLRKEKSIKQVELADTIGAARPYLSDIERDKKTLSNKMAKKISKVLGVSPGYLLGKEEAENQESLSKTDKKDWETRFKTALGTGGLDNSENNSEILFHYGFHFLPKLNEIHRVLYENPKNKMLAELRSGMDIEKVLNDNGDLLELMKEYAIYAGNTMQLLNNSQRMSRFQDLMVRMAELNKAS